ncbi:Sodium/calcium exchanger protein-domain-containing protein [Schizophyllum amplum]|uniref:Vacuolar calcium ion transporter n=1 Tax=Schizophyllum amplum TaxID=97359 RepID=A0A550C161_9AGAR|nr:Sodium/calcium exchanger protein-domain-containing protein [Auriculariopsis ampla]
MGETCASDVSSNVNSVHARPSSALPSAVIAEDDDEPPSSGPSHRSPQVIPYTAFVHTPSLATDGATIAPVSKKLEALKEKIPFVRSATEKAEDSEQSVALQAPTKSQIIFSRLKTLFTPVKALGPEPTYAASFKATVRYTPLNFCLLFIPVSWALHYTHQSATLIFVFSCLGIIPLAALLGFGTEQVAHRTSSTVGGLLNATLGNVVEMIIAGIALKECNLELVQSSLLGGLLSNMLLVLGMAFIVGGFRFHSQEFQPMVAQLNSSLMTVSVISLIIPAAFHEYLEDRLQPGAELPILLQLSRGSAVLLILIYFAYLVFQFYSHNHLFVDTETISTATLGTRSLSRTTTTTTTSSECEQPTLQADPEVAFTDSNVQHLKLNAWYSLILLVAVTALCYLTAECLVDSLEGLIEAHPSVSTEWITLIIIPVISNAAEHTTAVIVASKGKFDLAMSVAIGSCIQIALFVIPVLVLVAWGMDKPLTLLFDPLETLVLFFSVILVKFSVEDGKAHWMSGVVLVGVYCLLALSFWNFPDAPRMLQGSELTCS